MGQRYDYGSWWSYVFQRLDGLEFAEVNLRQVPPTPPKPGGIGLGSFIDRRDRQLSNEAYGASLPDTGESRHAPVCRAPISYRSQDAVQQDIANPRAALDAAGLTDGYRLGQARVPGRGGRTGHQAAMGLSRRSARIRA